LSTAATRRDPVASSLSIKRREDVLDEAAWLCIRATVPQSRALPPFEAETADPAGPAAVEGPLAPEVDQHHLGPVIAFTHTLDRNGGHHMHLRE
jgi:hypothetical protein